MKKVLAFSDVHGVTEGLEDILSNVEYDILVYLGDWAQRDRTILEQYGAICVQGNNPHESEVDVNKIIEIEDVKVLLTHGHYFSSFTEYVSNKRLAEFAKPHDVSLVIHGHTHVKKNDIHDDIQIINPGSYSDPRDGSKGSYALITIDGDKVLDVEFIYV